MGIPRQSCYQSLAVTSSPQCTGNSASKVVKQFPSSGVNVVCVAAMHSDNRMPVRME